MAGKIIRPEAFSQETEGLLIGELVHFRIFLNDGRSMTRKAPREHEHVVIAALFETGIPVYDTDPEIKTHLPPHKIDSIVTFQSEAAIQRFEGLPSADRETIKRGFLNREELKADRQRKEGRSGKRARSK